MTSLAHHYRNGEGVPQDWSKAVELYRQAAKKGHTVAQYTLAHIYSNGFEEIPVDLYEAKKWIDFAAAGDLSKLPLRRQRFITRLKGFIYFRLGLQFPQENQPRVHSRGGSSRKKVKNCADAMGRRVRVR